MSRGRVVSHRSSSPIVTRPLRAGICASGAEYSGRRGFRLTAVPRSSDTGGSPRSAGPSALPPTADPLTPSESSEEVSGTLMLSRSELDAVIHSATMAPSVLNIQPWRFVARTDGAIELHRDLGRTLPVVDPRHRALTVSCGAALFNLRLAVAFAGRVPEVQLLPEGSDVSLLATVRAVEPQPPSSTDLRLFGVISTRRTSRQPYVDHPLELEMIKRLGEVAALEGASLRVLDSDEATRAAELVHSADAAQRSDPSVRAEVARWTNRPTGAVDGIPATALGPSPRDPSSLVRDFAMGGPVHGRTSADFELDPTLAVLLTAGDAVWTGSGPARRSSGCGSRPLPQGWRSRS